MTNRTDTGRPAAIDLFAGAGGFSLGLEQAGFDVVAAVEYDAIHAATHLHNFPHTPVIVASASDLGGPDVRERAGLGDRKVSLVVGGPPCQGFSSSGLRALDDPRNRLVADFVRIAAELDADYFVFENVKGMTLGHGLPVLEAAIEMAGRLGYDVVLPYRVLNAKDFRVPQSRERLFVMGHRRGLAPPRYPRAVLETVTCADAFEGLPDLDAFQDLVLGDSAPHVFQPPSGRYAREMRTASRQDWFLGYPRLWDMDRLTASNRTFHAPEIVDRFARTREGKPERVSNFFRLPRDGVANTLRAGTDAKRGSFTSPRPIHFDHPRCVSVREMARLHGFPDWFRPHATKAHGARQIGNAVPPPLARAIGGSVMEAIGARIEAPTATLAMGDEGLILADMERACRMMAASNLVGNRTRRPSAKAA